MYQFFVDPGQIHPEEKRVVITGSDVNHIRNVLRMKVGEEISVSNGEDGREYRCGILELTEDADIADTLLGMLTNPIVWPFSAILPKKLKSNLSM